MAVLGEGRLRNLNEVQIQESTTSIYYIGDNVAEVIKTCARDIENKTIYSAELYKDETLTHKDTGESPWVLRVVDRITDRRE